MFLSVFFLGTVRALHRIDNFNGFQDYQLNTLKSDYFGSLMVDVLVSSPFITAKWHLIYYKPPLLYWWIRFIDTKFHHLCAFKPLRFPQNSFNNNMCKNICNDRHRRRVIFPPGGAQVDFFGEFHSVFLIIWETRKTWALLFCPKLVILMWKFFAPRLIEC